MFGLVTYIMLECEVPDKFPILLLMCYPISEPSHSVFLFEWTIGDLFDRRDDDDEQTPYFEHRAAQRL